MTQHFPTEIWVSQKEKMPSNTPWDHKLSGQYGGSFCSKARSHPWKKTDNSTCLQISMQAFHFQWKEQCGLYDYHVRKLDRQGITPLFIFCMKFAWSIKNADFLEYKLDRRFLVENIEDLLLPQVTCSWGNKNTHSHYLEWLTMSGEVNTTIPLYC